MQVNLGFAGLRTHAAARARRVLRLAQGRSGQHGVVAHGAIGTNVEIAGHRHGQVQFATAALEAAAMATSLMLDEFTAQNPGWFRPRSSLAVVVPRALLDNAGFALFFFLD